MGMSIVGYCDSTERKYFEKPNQLHSIIESFKNNNNDPKYIRVICSSRMER